MILRALTLAVALLGGLLASQAPAFVGQYRQRVGGAIDELRAVVARLDQDAAREGTDRAGALARLEAAPDPIARRRGEAARADAARLSSLEAQRAAVDAAGPFGRIAAVLRDPDPVVWRGASADFEPAVPATEEGLTTGAAGAGLGYLLMRLLAAPFRRAGRWRRARAA